MPDLAPRTGRTLHQHTPAKLGSKIGKYKPLNANQVRTSDFPEFARTKWRSTFLPTLYEEFFSSSEPFDAFCKGSNKFIALLQDTVTRVYPDVDYEVTGLDSIHLLVCSFAWLQLVELSLTKLYMSFYKLTIALTRRGPVSDQMQSNFLPTTSRLLEEKAKRRNGFVGPCAQMGCYSFVIQHRLDRQLIAVKTTTRYGFYH